MSPEPAPQRTNFLEEAPGVLSSMRIVMVAGLALLIGAIVYATVRGMELPEIPASWISAMGLLIGGKVAQATFAEK